MKKIILYIVILSLITIGYFSYTKLNESKINSISIVNTATTTDNLPTIKNPYLDDPACGDSKYDSYLDAGFGVVQVSEGFIKKDMPIKAILSCDHTKLTITGSVNQEIIEPEAGNILVDGPGFPVLDEDYNFDGYNDISTMSSQGQGWTAIYSSYYFLYDSVQNKFIFNEMLSKMSNLSIKSTSTKTLYQHFGLGPSQGYNEIIWKWKDGYLVKISDKIVRYDIQ